MQPIANSWSYVLAGWIALGFRALRQETTVAHREQLTRFRFRHRRQAYLTSLEERWATAAPS